MERLEGKFLTPAGVMNEPIAPQKLSPQPELAANPGDNMLNVRPEAGVEPEVIARERVADT